MRTISQAIMNQLFEATDDLFLDREALQVPLLMAGEGGVRTLGSGRFEITLPDAGDLAPFLARLPELLQAAGFEPPADPFEP